MILGVDLGYSYTKDSSGHRFRSAYKYGNNILGGISLEIGDNQYTIGLGNGTVDENKVLSEVNKLCFLTVLGLNGSGGYYIVVGLPISHYKSQKDSLRSQITSTIGVKFKINGDDRTVSVYDCIVFPECIGAIFSMDITQDVIIVDIGGRTTDIAYLEYIGDKYQLSRHDTLYFGTMKLNHEVIETVNNKFQMSLSSDYAEKILKGGLTVNGISQDVSFLIPVIRNYILPITEKIKLDYPHKTTKMLLCGGGAEFLQTAFKKHFNSDVIPNAQFANANGFRVIGDKQFGRG